MGYPNIQLLLRPGEVRLQSDVRERCERRRRRRWSRSVRSMSERTVNGQRCSLRPVRCFHRFEGLDVGRQTMRGTYTIRDEVRIGLLSYRTASKTTHPSPSFNETKVRLDPYTALGTLLFGVPSTLGGFEDSWHDDRTPGTWTHRPRTARGRTSPSNGFPRMASNLIAKGLQRVDLVAEADFLFSFSFSRLPRARRSIGACSRMSKLVT